MVIPGHNAGRAIAPKAIRESPVLRVFDEYPAGPTHQFPIVLIGRSAAQADLIVASVRVRAWP
jgi:hypothetical protein